MAIGVFMLAPLPFGSAETVWICILATLLASSLVTADLRSATIHDVYLLLPLFTVRAIVITMQLWPNPVLRPVDVAWAAARDATGETLPGRASIIANGPWLAFGYPLLFVLAFTRAADTNSPRRARMIRAGQLAREWALPRQFAS